MSSKSPDAPATWPKSPVRTTPGCAATDKIWLPQAESYFDRIPACRESLSICTAWAAVRVGPECSRG
jgi:hypothetical protein